MYSYKLNDVSTVMEIRNIFDKITILATELINLFYSIEVIKVKKSRKKILLFWIDYVYITKT